jgi:hypothetical protein
MRVPFILILLALLMGSASGQPVHGSYELDPSALSLVAEVNSLRENATLQPLVADSRSCSRIMRQLSEMSRTKGITAISGSDFLDLLERAVPDAEKQCFVVRSDSREGLWEELLSVEGFRDAALNEAASHIVAAVRAAPDEDTGVQAGLCVVRRLVDLDEWSVAIMPEGTTFLTVSGRCDFPWLLVRSQPEGEAPTGGVLPSDSLRVAVDDSGRFEFKLSFSSVLVPVHYRVTMLVRGTEDEEYKEAAVLHHLALVASHRYEPMQVPTISIEDSTGGARSN